MNGTSTTRVKVDIGGNGVVPRVGLHALGSFADQLGLGDALSSAMPQRPTLSARPRQGVGHQFTDRTAELALFGTVEHHLPCPSACATSSCAGSSAW